MTGLMIIEKAQSFYGEMKVSNKAHSLKTS